MDAEQLKRFEEARHIAAAALRPEHIPDFMRLVKDLLFGSRFQLLIAEFNDQLYRDTLIDRVDQVLAASRLRAARLHLSPETHPDFAAVESELRELAKTYHAVHVTGGEGWFDAGRWEAFNIRREAVAQGVPARLILWLTAEPIGRLALAAPDLWVWRSGVFSFATAPLVRNEPLVAWHAPIENRSLPERSRRIATLRAYLDAEPPLDPELRLPLLDELASLLVSIGEFGDALRIRTEEQLPVYERLGDARAKAVTQGQIADIHEAHGQFDKALRIRTEEELPIYERLGDARAKAVAQSQIADILQARGQLDEALRIRTEEELPVYERLGDVRAKAITQSKIADILQARGQLDEALRIRTEEQLPVFERLGDTRAKAITQGQIADILQSRGQLDEALRIHTEEELPVYEHLGAVREKAITQGKIADILQARGRLDEALRILTEEQLPVYERLGDIHSKAITQGRIADILQARGQLDEALRIRTEEELPIYERLGAVRELLVCKANLALGLLSRGGAGDRDAAGNYLCEALTAARAMNIPEAAQIVALLLVHGIRCDSLPAEQWEKLERQWQSEQPRGTE